MIEWDQIFRHKWDLYLTEIKALVQKEITETRFQHTLRVANFAFLLAESHRYHEPKKAYLAGILHDITKQKKDEFHIQLFERSKIEYKNLPHEAFHAFSAPLYLEKILGWKEEEVFLAIQSHTLGSKSMGLLEQILYAADFLGSEYAEKKPELPLWIEETKNNLQYGVTLKATKTISFLVEHKKPIHQNTIDTYNHSLKG